ncbi:sigma factor-like helix-turn-helix DNA-binding protein [Brachyspira innocens]|uniref:Sigma factor-like helix-turn-helix DNA-binding protein n=1 Tax=Brachyspira innocens TaxID=13264 RepID=A0ABT8YUP0_9SPIR|nr:sigma factor-like helix-turn-helix DNA-binding protein [Brachyspira innocens]MDO6992890.1 sigma factor-like helix-turn-helix DNA-binding protein [Brachyspira innocens]MDO7019155.1 sigma factor-like helix-turn-helix DNA-binding protein [Brachyspira innocens]
MTCDKCTKKKECTALCKDMEAKLMNSLKNNNFYAESTNKNMNRKYNDCLSQTIYIYGCSEYEHKKIRRVIVALLSKEQRQVLELYNEGLSQKEIAEQLGTNQANISAKLKHIKKTIKKGLVCVIERIIE